MRRTECETVVWSRPARNGPTRGSDHSVTSRTRSPCCRVPRPRWPGIDSKSESDRCNRFRSFVGREEVLVLERVDRAKNMARFYVLSIEPTLFEDLALVRRWGRVGSAGRQRIDLHPSRPIAQIELKKWLDRKRRRGYQLRA